ncbi:MAG TPA: hypothetical protein VK386_09915 [Acidimicrobiales bacterium]|nr:hypothetical protein [Acidimicrobiales bacterium]
MHSNFPVAVLVAVVLVLATRPMARQLAAQERDQRLYTVVMTSVVLHLLAAGALIWVVDHYYHGITDYNRYLSQGAILGPRFRRFDFSLAGTNQKFLGAGSVSVFVGLVFAVIGENKLGAFFVFGWFAFLGTMGFYRAFATTFPEAEHRRYALMLFFLPSLIFWTAGTSKEAVMYISVGIAADGAARLLARRRRGVALLALGIVIGIYVRPQELLLFLGCVAAATLFRPRARDQSFRVLRFVAIALVQAVLLIAVITLTQKLAKSGAAVFSLSTVAKNNSHEASSIPYVSGPKGFPHDVYVMLFDPTLLNAHGTSQRLAALENTVIMVLIVTSWRRLLLLPRVCFARPYVMVAIVDLVGFCYAFASLSNLGLIDRERVIALPFLLLLLAIPKAAKGQPKFPWEQSRRRRRALERARGPNYATWAPRPLTGPMPPARPGT